MSEIRKNCTRCHKEFIVNDRKYNNKKYCFECDIIREQERKFRSEKTEFDKFCVCCGEHFKSKSKVAKYCKQCSAISKLVIQREYNNNSRRISITGTDAEQKENIDYLFEQIKKEFIVGKPFKRDILEKALTIYLDYLQGEL